MTTTATTFPLANNATLVADNAREFFLPNLCQNKLKAMVVFENTIYKKAKELASNYNGGYWQFVEIIAPNGKKYGFIHPDGGTYIVNTWQGDIEMDAVSFGIVVTLLATNALAWAFSNSDMETAKLFNDLYYGLYNWLYADETYEQVAEIVGQDERDLFYKHVYQILD